MNEREIYPINIRLRAFFASDLTNFSYFDSTAGFRRLCNFPDEKLPLEITLFRDDIANHVTLWDAPLRVTPSRPLKWCSTAIYWLTQEAAGDLGEGFDFGDLPGAKDRAIKLRFSTPNVNKSVPDIKFKDFHDLAMKQPAIIAFEPDKEHSPGVYHYVAGIGTKAIVQDYWMRTDPAARSYAHWRIAKRLYERRHRKEMLSEEFPFAPHWGRSGMFFLSECIRHLMRSINPVEYVSPPKSTPSLADDFVSPPTKSLMACDPYEVLRFCFGQVYWREIDGNSDEVDAMKLSQRHGLYHLSAELLRLMSDGEVLGNPHWALDRGLHARYYACAAFAQLELGNLDSARDLFNKRLTHISDTNPGSLEELSAKLDLIAAKIESHSMSGLSAEIEAIEQRLTGAFAGNPQAAAIAQTKCHCAILNGQIAYVRKDWAKARELLEGAYEEITDDRLSIEAAHYLVATLGAMADTPNKGGVDEAKVVESLRDEALNIASRKLWQYSSAGEQHVALGFRISVAHLFRNMGKLKLAETWMNSVYTDILKYGCSERTYLSFLREAGRIVRKKDCPARAYAVYLKPAAIRAASRGHARAAATAFDEASEALDEIQKLAHLEKASWPARLHKELQEAQEFSESADTKEHDFVPADPLFSFDHLSGTDWQDRLQTDEAIAAEREAFNAEYEGLSLLLFGNAAA